MTEILSNIWFWSCLTGLLLSIISLFIAMRLKKSHVSCIQELSRCLSNGEVEINQNFYKIQSCLNTLEHEIFSIAKNIANQTQQKPQIINLKSPMKEGLNGGKQTPSHSLKIVSGKKAQKYLTTKGKIKKKYRDNPIAQKCYQKFQALKQD